MEHLYVVAHSMGGLVSRAFIQRHFEATGERYVTRFVSIATPWGGMRAARMARLSRRIGGAAPPSWIDIAPKSRFLRSIFSREVEGGRVAHRLPDHVAYDLLFAFGGRHSAALVQVGEPPADGVVSLASQLAAQAREEAGGRIFAVDADHTSILRSEEAATYLQRVLEGTGSGRGER
jgi:alpha-beta hydrolase superfamily lysophospholipase